MYIYRIFTPNTQIIVINDEAMRDLYGGVDVTKEYGMVVNGDSLDKILVNKTYLKKWINLAKQSKGVIICRYFSRIVLSSNLVFYS